MDHLTINKQTQTVLVYVELKFKSSAYILKCCCRFSQNCDCHIFNRIQQKYTFLVRQLLPGYYAHVYVCVIHHALDHIFVYGINNCHPTRQSSELILMDVQVKMRPTHHTPHLPWSRESGNTRNSAVKFSRDFPMENWNWHQHDCHTGMASLSCAPTRNHTRAHAHAFICVCACVCGCRCVIQHGFDHVS